MEEPTNAQGILLILYFSPCRNNIAAAKLRGLEDDLNLSQSQYQTCLSILYVGYILMQVSTIFVQFAQMVTLEHRLRQI
jgi:hypothetical protein